MPIGRVRRSARSPDRYQRSELSAWSRRLSSGLSGRPLSGRSAAVLALAGCRRFGSPGSGSRSARSCGSGVRHMIVVVLHVVVVFHVVVGGSSDDHLAADHGNVGQARLLFDLHALGDLKSDRVYREEGKRVVHAPIGEVDLSVVQAVDLTKNEPSGARFVVSSDHVPQLGVGRPDPSDLNDVSTHASLTTRSGPDLRSSSRFHRYVVVMDTPPGITPGLVCGHHHLYSALARGMPAPPQTPGNFLQILEQVWWRLDTALDLEMLEWSAKLGALEALKSGCTAIVDHHESPNAIEGSLDVIADACAEVGVRVVCAYGVTDRHGSDGAKAGLAENERFIKAGGRGMVGIHAAFTCEMGTIDAAVDLADELGVGVHVHVAEGFSDAGSGSALARRSKDNWLLVHGVNLPDGIDLKGTLAHNPRSNMNNSVGYAHPSRFGCDIVLGTDGIGADMLDEFRLAYVKLREANVESTPDVAWGWLENGWKLVPEARHDTVTWNYPTMEPWHLAFTTGIHPIDVTIDDTKVLDGGRVTTVDEGEVRAKAAEQAVRLFSQL